VLAAIAAQTNRPTARHGDGRDVRTVPDDDTASTSSAAHETAAVGHLSPDAVDKPTAPAE
jgi:hypothetical protein